MVSDLPVYRRNATSVTVWIQKNGRLCVAWVWNQQGTEKLVNGKQHSVWFVPTGMNGLPQNVLLNFRLEFPKSDLTIYLPSGISEIFCQMVSTPGLSNSWFSHDVTKIQTKKLSLPQSFHFHVIFEHLKTFTQTNFRFQRVLCFAIQDAWIFRLLRDAAFRWRPGKLLCGSKKLKIFGEFAI